MNTFAYRWMNRISVSSESIISPSVDVCCILVLSACCPEWTQNWDSLFQKAWVSEMTPEILQIRRCRCFLRWCFAIRSIGSCSRSSLAESSTGCDVTMLASLGNYSWLGQYGTTTTPQALSFVIFRSMTKGRKGIELYSRPKQVWSAIQCQS